MQNGYDISSKSDMERFKRDLIKNVKETSRELIEEGGVEMDCPFCSKPFQMINGDNICPHCGETVAVTFDWSEF